ncbi:MAG TPA: ABC transporter ATP-binding protein [Xanthobacteraceae bacterium]|nr:ABC transporter ATP-binding protein [Xanthobacteraceae bacterium]
MKPPRSELLLRGEAVTVRLGKALVVDSANLTLRAGEFVALVGPNGAGKTTLMRALAGLQPARGKIELRERRLDSFGPRERARSIAYLPQGHVFYWPVSAASVVGLGRYPHADAFSRPSPEDATAVSRALKATGLEPLADRRVTTLSGGERARVALARALATEAPILFADEPTASLDPRHQLLVMEMLRRTTRTGAAVLAILHDITLAARFADRIVLMDGGRIVADGLPADALNPAQIAKVFGVEAIDVDIGEGVVPVLRRPI